jgi:hypothetical protein
MKEKQKIINWRLGAAMARVLALISIFCLLSSSFTLRASIITNDNTVILLFESSYDLQPYHYFGDYLGTWVALGHPQFTNHYSSASASGGLEARNTNHLEKIGLAHWANGKRAIGLIMVDDNDGLTSNQVQINLTNTLASPTNLFNGVSYTNEGGWCSTNSITWIGLGAIPHDSLDGDSGEIARNNAVTNMFNLLGRPYVDMWHPLWNPQGTEGWGPDETNGVTADWNTGSHPSAGNSLTMGINIARSLAGADTNVSLATVDFNSAAVVSTNHCVISSISKTASSISFTRLDDRLPMAWDVPNGTITNDCRDAFRVLPSMVNFFMFTLSVTNLPAGQYNVTVDGTLVDVKSAADLASGCNWFTNYNGPYWVQRSLVLYWVRLKDGADPVTLLDHSAGSNGTNNWADLVNYNSFAQSRWDAGDRGDTLITSMASESASLDLFDKQIHDAAQPVAHSISINPVIVRFAPFHR